MARRASRVPRPRSSPPPARAFSRAQVALKAVIDYSEVVAEWTDDEVFGWGNRPVYTNFAQIYYYFYWVSMPTATTLVFCAGNVALTIGAELRQIQVTCLLLVTRAESGMKLRPRSPP